MNYERWKGWGEDHFGATPPSDAAYFDAEVFRPLALPEHARILEIGFGNGYFMGHARQRGHPVTGIEANPALLDRAAKAGFEVCASADDLASDAFDAAVAFDVLEHIPAHEAIDFLRKIARSVKPGGAILLRFPNGDSPFGRVHQYGDVTHVNVIGSSKLTYLALAAGLSVVRTKNPEQPLAHRGLRAGAREFLRRTLASGVERLIGWTFFGTRLPMAPNLVAVLRKP